MLPSFHQYAAFFAFTALFTYQGGYRDARVRMFNKPEADFLRSTPHPKIIVQHRINTHPRLRQAIRTISSMISDFQEIKYTTSRYVVCVILSVNSIEYVPIFTNWSIIFSSQAHPSTTALEQVSVRLAILSCVPPDSEEHFAV
jgi:hypothetical protein